jgi:hypothetical protein
MPDPKNPERVAYESYELQKIMYDYYSGYMLNGRPRDELLRLIARCHELALDRANDDVRFEAIMLVLQFAEDLTGEESLSVWSDGVERLVHDYVNQPRVCRILEDYSILSPALRAEADSYSHRILKETNNAAVIANCEYAELAACMVKEQYCGGLTAEERRHAIQRLQRLRASYGGEANANPKLHFGATLDEVASGDIFELENLHVGAPAPEIDGKDLEGLPLRLSDYRGKVVFLKFWGDW